MSRQKSTLLAGVIAGALLLAQAGAVWLVLNAGLENASGWGIALLFVTLALWTGVITAAAVMGAQQVLLRGVEDACGRLEAARSSAHVGLLAAAPTLDLLGRTLRRQNAHLAELRDNLLAGAAAGGAPGGAVVQAHRLARAAGTAAGLLRSNSEVLRLVDTLEDWLTATRSRHETVRERAVELRELLERLPATAAMATPTDGDPVFGFAVADGAPPADGDAYAHLPPALRQRLLGQVPTEERDDEDIDRN